MPEKIQVPVVRARWAAVADGAIWRLTRGIDFSSTVRQAQQAFHAWCRYQGLKGTTKIESTNTILVQVTRENEVCRGEKA